MQEVFEKYFNFSAQTNAKLYQYTQLLRDANAKVNLLSRKDMDDVEYRHIALCAAISKFFTPAKGARIVDVGTGGGLPGIVMAILWPQAHITMLDGVGKKINMISYMIAELSLPNAVALNQRVEEQKAKFDYATGRSVCALDKFFGFVKHKLNGGQNGSLANGVIYFKGGEIEPQITARGIAPSASMDLEKFFGDSLFSGKTIVHFKTQDVVKF